MITSVLLKVLLASFIMSALSAFLLILAIKWKVIEYMQVHGNDFFSKLANCDFCLSWWANCILCLSAFSVTGDVVLLAVPFVATMITRKLI